MNRSIWLVLVISAAVLLCCETAGAREAPFAAGERLVYELRWGVVPAGEAVLEVIPEKNENGEQYHFRLTARTNSFVDIIYKVRDTIHSYTDKEMTHSLHYIKNQHEGRTRRDITVRFDWDKNEAKYTNFDRDKRTITLIPGAFDPFSILFFTRLCTLADNVVIERPVTDGKKMVMGRAQVVERETVRTRYGSFDSFVVEPELRHVGGVFEKSPNAKMRLWFSADSKQYLVRLQSKVVVGSFVADLVAVEKK